MLNLYFHTSHAAAWIAACLTAAASTKCHMQEIAPADHDMRLQYKSAPKDQLIITTFSTRISKLASQAGADWPIPDELHANRAFRLACNACKIS